MKQKISAVLTLLLFLTACSQSPSGVSGPTWQEQYDLGVRYLSEGNYEEAILAFDAAIQIDPKRAEAYIGLADVYIQQGDYDKALEILQTGLEQTGDQRLQERLDELDAQQEHEGLPENASRPVTVVGYIIFNSDKYREKRNFYIDRYTRAEEKIWCAIRSYGIQFEAPVDVHFDHESLAIQEAESGNVWEIFERTELYDYETDTAGSMIGRRMEMTGYFCPREEAGEITGPEYHEDDQMYYYIYHPNGEYEFYIQSYTILDQG